MFENHRHWLQRQSGMKDWESGCAALLAQLNQCLEAYLRDLEMRAPNPSRDTYLARLWGCWSWHWQCALETEGASQLNGDQVAASIRAGRGYAGQRRLGGDPLRDVVLAEAVCRGDDGATRRFTNDYQHGAVAVARKFSPTSVTCPDGWWHDFLTTHLAAFDRETDGALAKFQGYCGLSLWLPTVVKTYIRGTVRRHSRRREYPLSNDPAEGGPEVPQTEPVPGAEEKDCQQLLRRLCATALSSLKPREQVLLRNAFLRENTQKALARKLGVAEGRLSHIKGDALQNLRAGMDHAAEQGDQFSGYQECLDLMFQRPNLDYFVGVLTDVLEPFGERGDES